MDIPAVMNMIGQYRFWGLHDPARAGYRNLKSPKADVCIQCGQCEGKYTQRLHIMDEMQCPFCPLFLVALAGGGF